MLELKGLPTAIENERLCLGAALKDAVWCDQMVSLLAAEDFAVEKHRLIFRAAQECRSANIPVDAITLQTRLLQSGEAERVGGLSYLIDLDEKLPDICHPEHYARSVREKSVLRKIIYACNHTMNRAATDTESPDEILAGHQRSLADLHLTEHGDWLQPGQIMDQYPGGRLGFLQRKQDGSNGIPTPWPTITNDLCGGLHRGDLVLVAGRPSMGKSVVAMQLAYGAAKKGHSAAVISLEMSKESLVERMIACVGRVDHQKLKLGFLNAEERSRVLRASTEIESLPLWIDDTRARTIPAVTAAFRKLSSKQETPLLIIDHLQLMRGSKAESRNLELGEILHSLKILAGDTQTCVVCLSQLNRQCEIENRPPQLSDLKETGTSEEDADVVLFVHRPERYAKNRDREDLRGIAEFAIAKQRNGPAGQRQMIFLAQYQKFEMSAGDLE